MELQHLLAPSRQRSRSRHMDATRDDMTDVRGEIASVIEQIDSLREDLYGSSAKSRICCCSRRRRLRKLEDRLWQRLHQLQEKENELHRQRTVILSRSMRIVDAGGDESPVLRQHPPPVSPEAPEAHDAPESPVSSWQHRPPLYERRQLASTSTAEDHRPSNMVSDAALTLPSVPVRLPAPIPPQRPPSVRRRPSRPGCAEDTGSGAE